MNSKSLQSPAFKLWVFFAIVTLIVAPWRNSNPQDDAAWTYSIISLNSGGGRQGGGIAINLFQLILGLISVKALPFLPPIALLNFMTWIFFLGTVLLFFSFTQIHWLVVAALFSFPIWIQYGAIYHGEIYSAFLLVLTMGFLANPTVVRRPIVRYVVALLLSFFLSTQLQNMAVFPFFWGAFLILRKNRSDRGLGASLLVGSLLSVMMFALMPKTPFQQSYSYWLNQNWLKQNNPLFGFLGYAVEMVIATGLFVLPFMQIKARPLKDWLIAPVMQISAYLFLYFVPIVTMTGGILSLEYFPRSIAIGVLSLGVWGWWGIARQFKKIFEDEAAMPAWGTLAAFAVTTLFSTYRFAIDLRYMMTWTLPIIFHLRRPLREIKLLGQNPFYIWAVLIVSLVFNVYYLNTTDMRWRTAGEYEAQGIPQNQIGAGYGWNLFTIATDCMERALEKVERQTNEKPFWKSQLYYDRFLSLYGRTYEDEWIPKIVIKPSKFLGRKLDLNKYRLPGQDSEPIRFIDYTTLGIPSQLAVFENKNPKPAWCFQ